MKLMKPKESPYKKKVAVALRRRVTEDSIFYMPHPKGGKPAKQAPILHPSNISKFPKLFK